MGLINVGPVMEAYESHPKIVIVGIIILAVFAGIIVGMTLWPAPSV